MWPLMAVIYSVCMLGVCVFKSNLAGSTEGTCFLPILSNQSHLSFRDTVMSHPHKTTHTYERV